MTTRIRAACPAVLLLLLVAGAPLSARERPAIQRGQTPVVVPGPAIRSAGPVTAPPSRVKLVIPVQFTVAVPKAGQTIPLDGKVLQIPFTVQNLDVNKKYFFMPELVRNGATLGRTSSMGFVVNPNQSPIVVGAKNGHYLANYADQLAAPGPGYQYRITVYEGTWGKGHQVAATGLNGPFSLGGAP